MHRRTGLRPSRTPTPPDPAPAAAPPSAARTPGEHSTRPADIRTVVDGDGGGKGERTGVNGERAGVNGVGTAGDFGDRDRAHTALRRSPTDGDPGPQDRGADTRAPFHEVQLKEPPFQGH
ncbi:hypothetical protein SZN_12933 [Streptomyces zinciresistens K42]|uniref:Uncharacterized protein n=1 Tax=Streptomyces zinciresistens K42 TaxID=700597 RepID=G2GAR9_9ACTN|nr:hypothetical protein [Streptomyces zinciresistens]EGX59404.1 hypothetical protein SZN_12933 [Streptomyces zinciresistens K42]